MAPENTLASFRRAVEQGADEVELDLRLSADGRLVVLHDETVDRTTDGTGAVADLTFAELQALDAGGEPVPSFESVLDAVAVPLQVEIKAPEAVGPLAALLRERPAELDRISPCSFEPEVVAELVRLFPSTPVGLIASAGSAENVARAAGSGASRVLLGWPGTTRALVASAHRRGLDVSVWPVDTPAQLRAASDLGVDGFTTDHPGLIGAELARTAGARS
ncbi:glycerophosphoryl diester phosphodiesterase [Jiangella mangrovi]|uniref:Glycerophosphoryl diester phosphodiesterase n=1 Tax=Jiangella mangrovi TaxID=1524084 RepID=A0A7W9GTL5_9ACTN|nr:glycerophosphoryl diester phosphodiesterase [Jiangella mangrovi]